MTVLKREGCIYQAPGGVCCHPGRDRSRPPCPHCEGSPEVRRATREAIADGILPSTYKLVPCPGRVRTAVTDVAAGRLSLWPQMDGSLEVWRHTMAGAEYVGEAQPVGDVAPYDHYTPNLQKLDHFGY